MQNSVRTVTGGPCVQGSMRRFAWIWLAGCIVWLFNAGLSLHNHATQRAELNFLIAMLFGTAYAFYSTQKR